MPEDVVEGGRTHTVVVGICVGEARTPTNSLFCQMRLRSGFLVGFCNLNRMSFGTSAAA